MRQAEESARLFVAVLLPAEVREALASLIERGKKKGTDVRWTRKENLHITLKFLGDVRERDIPRVEKALQEAAAGAEGFRLCIRGLGAFPSEGRPRVLWAGVGEGSEELASLASRVEESLRPFGFPKEDRFSGHVTLGRLRHPEPSPWFRGWAEEEEMQPLEVGVRRFWLMKSTLAPSGAVYEPLAGFTLATGAVTRGAESDEE